MNYYRGLGFQFAFLSKPQNPLHFLKILSLEFFILDITGTTLISPRKYEIVIKKKTHEKLIVQKRAYIRFQPI